MPHPASLKRLLPQIASLGCNRLVIVRGRLTCEDHTKTSSLNEFGKDGWRKSVIEGLAQGTLNMFMNVWTGRIKNYPINHNYMDELLEEVEEADRELYNDGLPYLEKPALLFADLPAPENEGFLAPARKVLRSHFVSGKNCNDETLRVVMAIGPERGWTEGEYNTFTLTDESLPRFSPTSFGGNVLRTDTACVAGVGVIASVLEEIIEERESR